MCGGLGGLGVGVQLELDVGQWLKTQVEDQPPGLAWGPWWPGEPKRQ